MLRRSRLPFASCLLACGLLAAAARGDSPATLPRAMDVAFSDAEIEAIITRSCEFSAEEEFQRYRGGHQGDLDFEGPLYLTAAGEREAYGVLLPPFLRLHHYARTRPCSRVRVEEARELAGREDWVLLWRMETPRRDFGKRLHTGDKTLVPETVRLRSDHDWHEPLWSVKQSREAEAWFTRDWNEGESLIVAFPPLERSAVLWVDFRVREEGGRYHPDDTKLFLLHSYEDRWWNAAHGAEARP